MKEEYTLWEDIRVMGKGIFCMLVVTIPVISIMILILWLVGAKLWLVGAK